VRHDRTGNYVSAAAHGAYGDVSDNNEYRTVYINAFTIDYILSRDRSDGVWIRNWIYCPVTDRTYK
jgi:hypothetical protein